MHLLHKQKKIGCINGLKSLKIQKKKTKQTDINF